MSETWLEFLSFEFQICFRFRVSNFEIIKLYLLVHNQTHYVIRNRCNLAHVGAAFSRNSCCLSGQLNRGCKPLPRQPAIIKLSKWRITDSYHATRNP